jgi:aminoglycoside 3-N-acetyltransferase
VPPDTEPSKESGTDRPGPFTVDTLSHDLRILGLTSGATVLVHSSLSTLGYVAGGARAVVMALLETLGPLGTLVVPTHSGELSDPRYWSHPAMPAYDADLTATRKMGAIPEMVRHFPHAQRSAHPRVSFCAVGPKAQFITADHGLENGFDEHSPLARIYDLGGEILLLGVGHQNNTSLHLAEGRAPAMRPIITDGAPMMVNGSRQWVSYQMLDYDINDFDQVGAAAAHAGLERSGKVGAAPSSLLSVVALVDFATKWFAQHRTWSASSEP